MTKHASHNQTVSIERPRVADRLSSALRSAYGDMNGLPDDMVAMLMEIDRRAEGRDARVPRRGD